MILLDALCLVLYLFVVFFFKQKTAYEMRISDWSSDVCSSDLPLLTLPMFVYMGYMLSESGLAEDLYRMFHVWMGPLHGGLARSEERRVGQECVRTSRSRGSPDH